MKPVPGICDRCGLRFPLHELHYEYVLGKRTNLRTCIECHDESHPQLDTRFVRTVDEQTVKDSRPDTLDSRSMSGYYPNVGGSNSSTHINVRVGRVTIGGS